MKQEEFFNQSGRWFISGAQITIEELYQMFKERMTAEENDLIPNNEYED